MLKGLDMIIWEALGRLGLKASVKPVLSLEYFYDDEDEDKDRMVVGNDRALHMSRMLRIEDYSDMDRQIKEWRRGETLNSEEVHWLSKPTHKQLQLAYIAVSIRLKFHLRPTFALRNEFRTDLTFTQSTATRRAWGLSIRTVQSLPRFSQAMLA